MMKIALVLSLLCAVPAVARDSSHLICAGYMTAEPGPDNYGFAVQFDESRARDGESRLEVLSTVWAGNLYQGRRINSNHGFGENGTVVMTGKANANETLYNGSYNIIKDAKTGDYQLELKGDFNTTPGNSLPPVEQISTTLNCVNISN